MTTKITPTFFLKGIDPHKLLIDYNLGLFNRPVKEKSKIQIARNITILAPIYGKDSTAPTFTIKDRNNNNIIITTSNHKSYEVFTKSGGKLPTGGRCFHCRQDFTTEAVGRPIAYQENTLTSTNEKGEIIYLNVYIFWVEGIYCCYECMLGHTIMIMSKPADYRDTSLRDCERLAKLMYKLSHPKQPCLKPRSDPALLEENGGSLSRQEWETDKHCYVRTDRVLCIPAKTEYLRYNYVSSSPVDYVKELT